MMVRSACCALTMTKRTATMPPRIFLFFITIASLIVNYALGWTTRWLPPPPAQPCRSREDAQGWRTCTQGAAPSSTPQLNSLRFKAINSENKCCFFFSISCNPIRRGAIFTLKASSTPVEPASSSSSSSSSSSASASAASEESDNPTNTNPTDRHSKDEYIPYQGKQPADALPEIFIQQALPPTTMTSNNMNGNGSIDLVDERLWVPQTDTVSFRPLCFSVSNGYYVNLLRVKGSGLLSRHRHPGPVHGYVLKGSWKYLEHDWIATQGSYIYEPPGEIHTLVVVPTASTTIQNNNDDDDETNQEEMKQQEEEENEMITLFHVTGSLLYCDPDGNVIGMEDVFTKLEKAKAYYKSIGLGEDYVQQFLR